jgi:hypothetical protein
MVGKSPESLNNAREGNGDFVYMSASENFCNQVHTYLVIQLFIGVKSAREEMEGKVKGEEKKQLKRGKKKKDEKLRVERI